MTKWAWTPATRCAPVRAWLPLPRAHSSMSGATQDGLAGDQFDSLYKYYREVYAEVRAHNNARYPFVA